MRRTLLLIYLYTCALSILCQFPICLAQTANSVASCSDGQVSGNEERTVDQKQNEARMSDKTNQRIQRDQLIDRQTRDTVRQIRQKRGLREAANSVRFQESSNPSIRTGLTSSEQRFERSVHQTDQSYKKLVSTKNNSRISSVGEANISENQTNQDKRELHNQQVASSSSLSTKETEAKSNQKEGERSSDFSETVRAIKPKSRAIKESDLVFQDSFAEEKRKVHDNGRYTALGVDAKVQKPESGIDQFEDGVDLDEQSVEYQVTGDDDDDLEVPARNAGYKKTNPEVSQIGEGSEKLDLVQSSVEDDFGKQKMVKRETEVAGEEYNDIENQVDTCEDVNLVDESNFRQAKIRSETGLLKNKEKSDSRVKRHNIGATENALKENEAPNFNEAARQQLKVFQHLEDLNSKRETSQTEIAASSKSNFRPQEESIEDQVISEKREARLQQEAQLHSKDTSIAGEQLDVRLDGENNGNADRINEDIKKEAKVTMETRSGVEDESNNSKQESNLGITAKDNELDSDYEKQVEEQIQQKIESIKEQVKREVEEKQRIREIEANNAKYDEIQSEIEEDEDENNESLDIPIDRKSVSKRSIVDRIRSPHMKTNRHILRSVKRSDTIDARQLQAIEGVEKLDPDVLTKAQLRHESIRKRSAPIYGVADQDVLDTSKPLTKRSAKPRTVYLVNNEQNKSPIRRGREVRNTIIIPEQAHVNVEDELPPGLFLDPSLLRDPSSPVNFRFKRSVDQFARQRRANAIIPEGRVAFLGYRPQDDEENDEGSEFDDDGFEDRTSNLQQDKSYVVAHVPMHDQYDGVEPSDENPANFLFSGIDGGREDFLLRRKRAGIREDEEPVHLRKGGALTRRQTRAKPKQMQVRKISSNENVMDRDKRQTESGFDDTKFDSVASLVGSSQELSPRLATEYKEAFGGLQSDPGGAFARFKRVKRDALRSSLD